MSTTPKSNSIKNVSDQKQESSSSNDPNYKFDVGSLEMIIFGPMFSGKTTKLINKLTTCADVGLNTMYINHLDDVRCVESVDEYATTHSSQFKGLSSKITGLKTLSLIDVDVSGFDVIGIDEGQFFDDLVEAVRKWVLQDKKQIFIASLDGDHTIKPFGHAHELICLCQPDGIIKKSAPCMDCMKETIPYRRMVTVPAGFTCRLKNMTDSGGIPQQKDIGGAEKYIAVCLKCYQTHNFKSS